jgi:DNA-binding transcriptional LysR family regulator
MLMSRASLPLLELDLLRTFVAICESGNFSRAAERVFRTPSAVSLQMKKLEDLVGRELFIREARKAIPTCDADMLLVYARQILQLNQEVMRLFHAPLVSGRVRFGATDDVGNGNIAEVMQRFARTHPDVELEVCLERSGLLEDKFMKGELDVALTMSCKTTNVHARKIMTEELAWVAKRNFQMPVDAPLPLVMVARDCIWTVMACSALDAAGIAHRLAYTCPQLQSILTAVEAGLAVAVLPISVVPDSCVVLNESLPPLGEYSLYLAQQPDASEAVTAFHTHLLQTFDNQPDKCRRLFG